MGAAPKSGNLSDKRRQLASYLAARSTEAGSVTDALSDPRPEKEVAF